jgi:poly(3-hydroxybutyrate) depolymerase
MSRGPRAVVCAVLVSLATTATGAEAAASDRPTRPDARTAASLPTVPSGARPGPDVLYAPPPTAPQLENRDRRFRAAPLLVSGHEAYAKGEYLYQDHLYDDYGADTDGQGAGSLGERVGDITYPADAERYAGNAADLVEFRIAAERDRVTYRITLNSLLEQDSTIVALAFDTDRDAATGTTTLPRDPGAPFPGTDQLITTWGTGAEHVSFTADGAVAATTPVQVHTDLEANQLTITVPRRVSDPRGSWRATLATGLYDPATGNWLRPQPVADADTPGGAGPLNPAPSGILNLGFRFDEPVVGSNTPPDTAQAEALTASEPARYAHDIDFAALAAGVSRTTVPAHGTTIRIFPSRLDLGEGRDLDGGFPQYRGQLQPYSLYVPTGYRPGRPAGLTLALHSLGQQHWQYNGSSGVQQIGEARGNVVATSLSRGPDGWYQHEAEFDVFEMWNDVARVVTLDPDRTAISGYSMGGYATYRLGTLYPDLFGRAFSTVGPPGDGIWVPPAPPTGGVETLSNLWLENARNLPYLNVAAGADELVPVVGPRAQNLGAPEVGVRGFEQLGYRYRFVVYPAAEHFTLARLGYDIPMAREFLGESRVDRNPHHVSFAYVPAADDAALGLVHDHAYWVSEVRPASTAAGAGSGGTLPAKALVDAFSHGFGLGDPASTPGADAGVGPLPWTEVNRSWGPAPRIPVANRLDLRLTNVGTTDLDLSRARLDPKRQLTVVASADRDGAVRLVGRFPVGTRVLRDGRPVQVVADRAGLTLPVVTGEHVYTVIPSR